MNTNRRKNTIALGIAATLGSVSLAHADLFVSNFNTLGATGAQGVWRNQTTATDLTIPVEISQSGGTVKPMDGSGTESKIDDDFPWQGFPPLTPFTPNFNGDFINIETAENGTTTVTFTFNALITDPVISFTDVEYRTTITSSEPFTVLASTSNLSATSTTFTSDRSPAANDNFGIFGEEAAGSIQFTGTFSEITFTVAVAEGDAGVGNNDRTGYVISTMTAPEPLSPVGEPKLSISYNTGSINLTWELGQFSEIQMSNENASGWIAIPGLDPGAVNSWSETMQTLGQRRIFRGIYLE